MFLSRLLHRLIYTCRDTTLLLEKEDHVGLSCVEHLRLRLHLLLCAPCTAYQRKRRALSRWMREQTESLPSPAPKAVEELQERLREEMKLDRPESNG